MVLFPDVVIDLNMATVEGFMSRNDFTSLYEIKPPGETANKNQIISNGVFQPLLLSNTMLIERYISQRQHFEKHIDGYQCLKVWQYIRNFENEIKHPFVLDLPLVDETLFVIGRFQDELLLLWENSRQPQVLL